MGRTERAARLQSRKDGNTKMSIRIMGTGSALPARQVDNRELAGMVDTSDEWIRERTGIGSRHVSTGETVVSLAVEACERALENAGRDAASVELILAATCTAERGAGEDRGGERRGL